MSDYDAFARYFDLFSGQAADDLPVYLGLAQRTGSPILELGCGSGRVMVALAQAGYAVTGLDNAPEMLAMARRKIEQAGWTERVTLVQADLRHLSILSGGIAAVEGCGDAKFAFDTRFKLAICAQNTFCHMLTQADQLALLDTAKRCLEPGGLLALDVFNPDPAVLAGSDQRLVLTGIATDPATGHTLTQTMAREIDAGEQIEHITLFVDEMDAARLVGRRVFQFDLRYVFRFELELLLDKAGFELEALYGSYDLEPFDNASERLLIVARAALKKLPLV
jgi:SAM-dependent methyltransferase